MIGQMQLQNPHGLLLVQFDHITEPFIQLDCFLEPAVQIGLVISMDLIVNLQHKSNLLLDRPVHFTSPVLSIASAVHL